MTTDAIEKNETTCLHVDTERATIISALLKLRSIFSCRSCEESYGSGNDHRCVNINMLVNHRCGHFFCSRCWDSQRENKTDECSSLRCPVCNMEVSNELNGVQSANHFFYPLFHNFDNLALTLKQIDSVSYLEKKENKTPVYNFNQISSSDHNLETVENRNEETNRGGTSSTKLMISSRNTNGGRASFGVKYVSPTNDEKNRNVNRKSVEHNQSNNGKKRRRNPKRLSLNAGTKYAIETNVTCSKAILNEKNYFEKSICNDTTDNYNYRRKSETIGEDLEFHSQSSLPNKCVESSTPTKPSNPETNSTHYSVSNKELSNIQLKLSGNIDKTIESKIIEESDVPKDSPVKISNISKYPRELQSKLLAQNVLNTERIHQQPSTSTEPTNVSLNATSPLINNETKQKRREKKCISPKNHTPPNKKIKTFKSCLFFPQHSLSPPFELDQESTSSEHPPELMNDKIIEYFEPEDEYENTYPQEPVHFPITSYKSMFDQLGQPSPLTSYSQQSLVSEHPPESVETYIESNEFPQLFDESSQFQSPVKSELQASKDHSISPDSLERDFRMLDKNNIFDDYNHEPKTNLANENHLTQAQSTENFDFIQNQCQQPLKQIQFQTANSQTSSQDYVPGTCQEIGNIDVVTENFDSDMKLNSLFTKNGHITNQNSIMVNRLPNASNDDFLSQNSCHALVEGTDPRVRIAETQCVQEDSMKMSLNSATVPETEPYPESPSPLNLVVFAEPKSFLYPKTSICSNDNIIFETEPHQECKSAESKSQGGKYSPPYRNKQNFHCPYSPLIDDQLLSMKQASLNENQSRNLKKQNYDRISIKLEKASNSMNQIIQGNSGSKEPTILETSIFPDSKEEICCQNSHQEDDVLINNESNKLMKTSEVQFKDFEYTIINSKNKKNESNDNNKILAMIVSKKANKIDENNESLVYEKNEAIFKTRIESNKEESTNETNYQNFHDGVTMIRKDLNLEAPVETVISPSDILKKGNNLMKFPILSLDFMTNEDLDRAHQLQTEGICVFRKEIGYFNAIDSNNKKSPGDKIYPTSIKFQCTSHLIVHAIPKLIQMKEISIKVKLCVRSFKYLLALALGLEVIESGWLKADEIGKDWPNENRYRIWGDFALYNQLIKPQEKGEIYLSKAYVEKLRNKGVCYVSKSFVKKVKRKKIPHKLSNYYIALLGFNTKAHSDCDMKSILANRINDFPQSGESADKAKKQFALFIDEHVVGSGENNVAENEIGDVVSLTLEEVKKLIYAWGGVPIKTGNELGWKYPVPDVDKRLIIVPDSLSEEELRIFINDNKSNMILFQRSCCFKKIDTDTDISFTMCDQVVIVRCSWISDSIASCAVAPLKPYCCGILCWDI